jgi:thiosulfate/3-mercaptopyruvate sulfurtransferase
VTGDELAKRLADGSVSLLDVRSRAEFDGREGYGCDPRQGHIPGAVHLEWTELIRGAGPADPAAVGRVLAEHGVDLEKELVVYCHSGQRSAFAATALRSAGFAATNYEGSWHEWSRREPADPA